MHKGPPIILTSDFRFETMKPILMEWQIYNAECKKHSMKNLIFFKKVSFKRISKIKTVPEKTKL